MKRADTSVLGEVTKSNVFYENKIAFAIIAQVYITPDCI